MQATNLDRSKSLETKSGANDNTKLVERLDRIEAKVNRPGTKASNDNEPQVETKALNKFLHAGVQSLDDLERKTLNLGTTTAGGYVVAPEYSTKIVEGLTQFSPLRGLASSMTIGGTGNLHSRRTPAPPMAAGLLRPAPARDDRAGVRTGRHQDV